MPNPPPWMSSTVRLRERVHRGSTPPRGPATQQAPLRRRHQRRCQDCSPARRSACRRFLRNQPARHRVFHSSALRPMFRPTGLRPTFRPPALRLMFHRQGPRSARSGRCRCHAPTCFESCSIRCRCRRRPRQGRRTHLLLRESRRLRRHRCQRRRGDAPDRCPGLRRLRLGPPRGPGPDPRRRLDAAARPAGSPPRRPPRRRRPARGRSRGRPARSCRRGAGARPSAPVPGAPRRRSIRRRLRAISGPG